MDRATAQTQIDNIDAILAGPEEVTLNGRRVRYNFEQLQAQRNRLQRYLNGTQLRVGRYNPGYPNS